MEIRGIYVPSSLNQNQFNKFKLGERMLVEIISKINEGEGTVRFRGQNIPALLETNTQVGEKFWAKVGGLKEGGLLLIRETSQSKEEAGPAPPQNLLLTERGLPKNPELLRLIKSFPTTTMEVFDSLFKNLPETAADEEILVNLKKLVQEGGNLSEDNGAEELLANLRKFGPDEQRLQQMLKTDSQDREIENNQLKDTFKGMLLKMIDNQRGSDSADRPLAQLLEEITGRQLGFKTGAQDNSYMLLQKLIPEWKSLAEDNGVEELLAHLKKFGLDYEHRLQQMLKMDSQDREIEKNQLKDTFKGMLLKMIGSQRGADSADGPLAQLLEKITGQQLWLKTGTLDNAYMMLHLPLKDQGEFVPVQIAMESARKGLKMDEQHCRVAIMLETQALGKIGLDAYFSEDAVTCRVLSHDAEYLPELLERVIPETRVGLGKLGFNLGKIEIGDLEENLEFKHFLQGARRSGVDILR